ncbi:glycosyltransferase family 4 protein [Aeromicrobium sp. CF4.19]|uniref:glycosyltransferase family 4 protein n=1 Tax=Aeromicrobium sp. CF4.19 TaxID=3373082 RepID=UPI003EE4D9D5
MTGIGGTERRAAEFIPRLAELGVDCQSLHLGEKGARFDSFLHSLGPRTLRATSPLDALRHLRNERSDVILAFGLRASLIARFARLVGTQALVVDARNGLEYGRGRAGWTVDRWTQRLVHRYMTNSQAAAEVLTRHGIAPHRVRTNASALGGDWLSKQDVVREKRRVLMIGNARPEKAQLDGVAAALAVDIPLHLVVFTNDGSAVRNAWALAAPGSEKTMEIFESTLVTPADYARASVLLHPSRSESLPRVVLEAKAQSVRVVATDVGDTAMVLGPRDRCVPPADRKSLTNALKLALDESASASELPDPVRTIDQYCQDLLEVCAIPR